MTTVSMRVFTLLLAGSLIVAQSSCPALSQAVRTNSGDPTPEPLRGRATVTQPDSPTRAAHPVTPDAATRRTVNDARQAMAQHRWDEAEALLQNHLAADPSNPFIHHMLGVLNEARAVSSDQTLRDRRKDLNAAAVQNYLSALRYAPGYLQAMLDLGTRYKKEGRLIEAMDLFRDGMALDPSEGRFYARMASAFNQQKEWTAALSMAQQAQALNPDLPDAYEALGEACLARGQWHEAHEALSRGLALAPQNDRLHALLARALAEQENGAAAVTEWQTALRLNPENAEASRGLADYYRLRGDNALALAVLKNASATDAHNADWMHQVAELALSDQQPAVAAVYYQRALLEKPGDARAKLGLAQSRLAMDAQRQTRTAPWGAGSTVTLASAGVLEALPAQVPQAAFAQASRLLEKYRFDEANRLYTEALRMVPDTRGAMTYGEMFLAMGLPDLAIAAYEKVLTHSRNADWVHQATLGQQRALENKRQAASLVADAASYHRSNAEQPARLIGTALRLDRQYAPAYLELAKHQEWQKQLTLAMDSYYAYQQLAISPRERDAMARKISGLQKKALSN
ncbi:MAG: tetratricopeptide repeat protein [Candidatus Melainabacteria bacterium]